MERSTWTRASHEVPSVTREPRVDPVGHLLRANALAPLAATAGIGGGNSVVTSCESVARRVATGTCVRAPRRWTCDRATCAELYADRPRQSIIGTNCRQTRCPKARPTRELADTVRSERCVADRCLWRGSRCRTPTPSASSTSSRALARQQLKKERRAPGRCAQGRHALPCSGQITRSRVAVGFMQLTVTPAECDTDYASSSHGRKHRRMETGREPDLRVEEPERRVLPRRPLPFEIHRVG